MKHELETQGIEDFQAQKIFEHPYFSKGYGYRSGAVNGLADKASPQEVAIANDLNLALAVIKNKRKRRAKAKAQNQVKVA